MWKDRFSRRDTLRIAGSLAATTGLVGVAAGGQADGVRMNVGYRTSAGRQAVVAQATTVHYDHAFDVLTVELPATTAEELAARGDVRFVEPDLALEAVDRPRDVSDDTPDVATGGTDDHAPVSLSGDQEPAWGVERIAAPAAHDDGHTGDGADIAVLDTGIQPGHPDLAGNLGAGMAFLAGVGADHWADDNGHGTHCAGTIAAADTDEGIIGVAPAATLHAVKVMGAPGIGFTSDIAAGLQWTADQGYDVANLSLGGDPSDTLEEACRYAADRGVLLVAATGNGSCDECVLYPAAYDAVLAVTATTQSDDIAAYSSTGPPVDLAAPGDDVQSTFLANSYARMSGTSMAAPHVAGVGGLLSADGLAAADAADRLVATAEDLGHDATGQGAGLVDAAAAVSFDGSTGDDAPGTTDEDGSGTSRDASSDRDESGDGEDTHSGTDSDGVRLLDRALAQLVP